MNTPFIPVAPTGGPQFDLPPIAPASQIAQQAAPFSQLLNQAQAAAPIPAPAPPPPSPPTPPAAPKTSAAPQTANSNGPAPDAPAEATPSAPNQASGDTASTDAPSANADAANGPETTQPAATPGADHTQGPQQPKANAKGAQPGKKGDNGSPQQSTAQPSVETAATAAKVLSSAVVTKKGDAGKGQKGDEKTSDAKNDATTQTNGAASASTPDAAAQAAATVVSTLSTAADTASQDVQADTKVKSAATKQTAKPAAAQATSKSQAAVGLIPTATQAGSGDQLPTDVAETTASAPAHAKGGEAATAPIEATRPNVPASVSPSDGVAASATVTASLPPPAEAVITVATSEAPVVSAITVDPSTTAASTGPTESASPPPAGSSPDYTPSNNAVAATPSAFATTMTQNAASAGSAGAGLNTIDRARFVQRVASAFQVAGDQGGQIRLRLSPPELGSLQMQISVKQGVLSATIQADNSTAQQVLLDSLPDLRDRLAQQDIRIDRFDVELMGQGSGGMPQPQGNPDFNQAGRRSSTSTNSIAATAPTEANHSPASVAVSTSGNLNIVV